MLLQVITYASVVLAITALAALVAFGIAYDRLRRELDGGAS